MAGHRDSIALRTGVELGGDQCWGQGAAHHRLWTLQANPSSDALTRTDSRRVPTIGPLAQTCLPGADHRLYPIGHLELAKDVGNVIPHGLDADG